MSSDEAHIIAPASRRWLFVPSQRVRLTLQTAGVFVLIQLVLSVGLYLYISQEHDAALQETLARQTASIAEQLASTSVMPSNASFNALVGDEPRSILVEDLLASLFTKDGHLLATNCKPEVSFAMSGGGEVAADGAPVHRGFDLRALLTPQGQRRPGRTFAMRLTDPTGRDLVLVTASGEALIAQLNRELRDTLLWAIPAGLIAALGAGWMIAGIAVTAMRRLEQIAQLLSPSAFGARIDFGSTATEVSRLQERLNEARRRLDAGYRAQEQFAGNVAHELKTPLAIIVAQADVIRASAGPDLAGGAAVHRRYAR